MIEASGVRRSWETACSRAAREIVGGGQLAGLVSLDVESLRLRGGGDLGGEGVEHPLVLRRQLTAGQGERHAAEVTDDVGFVGLLRWLDARCRHHGPASAAGVAAARPRGTRT